MSNEHMTLGELQEYLEAYKDQETVLEPGLRHPHSYRGYYDEVGFYPCNNITVGDMLVEVKRALKHCFPGWKGGQYSYTTNTRVWISAQGCLGDPLSLEMFPKHPQQATSENL